MAVRAIQGDLPWRASIEAAFIPSRLLPERIHLGQRHRE